jgi:hypothetical protein
VFSGLSGRGGVVRVGGREAATLTDWTVSYDTPNRAYRISTGLADVNPLYLSGSRPVEIRLQMQKRMWRWQGASIGIDGVRATVLATGEPDVM